MHTPITVYVRRAGPWNARDLELSSQFGHIMIEIDDIFYSFNQAQFIEDGDGSCVQAIGRDVFETKYAGQPWYRVELGLDDVARQKIVDYFAGPARELEYSPLNNCTRHCQSALMAAGISFPRPYIFPGSVLRSLKKRRAMLPIREIQCVVVEQAC